MPVWRSLNITVENKTVSTYKYILYINTYYNMPVIRFTTRQNYIHDQICRRGSRGDCRVESIDRLFFILW